jgi:hypothetical protein
MFSSANPKARFLKEKISERHFERRSSPREISIC